MQTRKSFLLENKEKYKFMNGKSPPTMTMKEKYLSQNIYKIGYLDIETSGLSADFDFMLTYSILVRDIESGKTEIRTAAVTKADFKKAESRKKPDSVDARITAKLMDDLADIDCLIGHWFIGKHRHDIPFIRSRCAINKIPGFPKHKMVRYGDTQRWGSAIHRLRNYSLATIGDAYGISTKKTPLKTDTWKKATMFGDRESIAYILHHNINDVKITYRVHKHVEEYVPLAAIYY